MGDEGEGPAGPRGPGTRGRPRLRLPWWVVLSVSLALMALVSAVTATDRTATGPHDVADRPLAPSPASRGPAPGAAAGATSPAPTLVPGGASGAAASTAVLPVTASVPSSGGTGTGTTTSPSPSPSPSPSSAPADGIPASSTTDGAGPAGNGSVSAPAAAPSSSAATTPVTTVAPPPPAATREARSASFDGTLGPSDPATTYQVPNAGGTVAASVNWDGGGDLALALNCPGAEQAASGPSVVSASVTSLSGTCSVIVSEPGLSAGVAFQLDVQYQG